MKSSGSVGKTTGAVGVYGGLSSLIVEVGTSELLSGAVSLGEGVSEGDDNSEVL